MTELKLLRGTISAAKGWARFSARRAGVRRTSPALRTLSIQRATPPPAAEILELEPYDAALSTAEYADGLALRLRANSAFRVESTSPFVFGDGEVGVAIDVRIQVLPGVTMLQRHVIRGSRRRIHHLLASVTGAHEARLRDEMRALLATYRPAA